METEIVRKGWKGRAEMDKKMESDEEGKGMGRKGKDKAKDRKGEAVRKGRKQWKGEGIKKKDAWKGKKERRKG